MFLAPGRMPTYCASCGGSTAAFACGSAARSAAASRWRARRTLVGARLRRFLTPVAAAGGSGAVAASTSRRRLGRWSRRRAACCAGLSSGLACSVDQPPYRPGS
eukprot:scaffold75889_cov66-Phaeocystis_antarctica.AAC.2